MADKHSDIDVDLETFNVSQVVLIQAYVRGALVRKWMREIKQSFEEVVLEIEKNTEAAVDWSLECVCKPKVVPRKKLKPKPKVEQTLLKQAKFHQNTLREIKDLDIRSGQNKTDKVTEACVEKTPSSHSVEIQTSFIDTHYQDKNADSVYKQNAWQAQTGDTDGNVLTNLDTSWKDRVESVSESELSDKGIIGDDKDNTDEFTPDLKLKLESDLETESLHSLNSVSSARTVDTVQSGKEFSNRLSKSSKNIDDADVNKVKAVENPIDPYIDEKLDNCPLSERSDKSLKSSRSQKSDQGSKSARSEKYAYSPRSDNSKSSRTERDNKYRHRSHSRERHDSKEKVKPKKLENEWDIDLPKSSRSDYSERSQRSCHSSRSQNSRSSNRDERSRPDQKEERLRSYHQDERSRSDSKGERSRSENSRKSSRSSQRDNKSRSGYEERSEENGVSDYDDRESIRSGRSEKSQDQRSDKSLGQRSAKVTDDERSVPNSDGSESGHRNLGRTKDSRQKEMASPRHSTRSPVQAPAVDTLSKEDNSYRREQDLQPPRLSGNSSTLTNVTSVWDSLNSVRVSQDVGFNSPLPQDPGHLQELRKNISMELLWIQQAIDSRKNYLRVKGSI